MADTQRKIVKVPDVGIVAFPGEMEDAQVAAVIKSYREKKKKEPSLTTEASEHKRQVKPAQPFSTAIPKLPDWANEPMLPKEQKWEESWNPALRAIHGKEAEARKQFDVQHPIAGGIGQGTQQFSESMTTPLNVGLVLGAPESKLLSAYFAIQAMRGSFRDAQAAAQAFKEGKNADASKYVTESLLGLGVAGMAGHHAVKDIPVPAPVKAFMADESGFVDPIKTWPQFKQWFGNSKVVDESGKPLVAFHGTTKDFDEFQKDRPDLRRGGTYPSVSHFSPDPRYVESFAGHESDQGGNIKPVYIKMENPYYTENLSDVEGAHVESYKPWIDELKAKGHDGIIYAKKGNIKKGPTGWGDDSPQYVTFYPAQVKSAIGNSGTFDPKSKSLTEPRAPNLPDVKAKAAKIQPTPVPLKPTTAYQSVDQSQPFYLKSENLINEKMKGPMPADDLHKMLLSNGVKPEEMKWTGLDELLQGKGKQKVTPQEIQEHLAGNNLQVQEVTKGAALGAKNPNELSVEEYGKPYDQLDAYQQRYIDTITEAHDKASPHATKFGSYVLPGAEPGSYREIVLTLPENRGNAARDARIAELVTERRKGIDNLQRLKSQLEESGYGPGTDSIVNEIRTQSAQIAKAEKDAADLRRDNHDSSFRSNHWPDEVNPIGHIRFNDRTGPNGEKILHLEELQSDWHQKGRKGRYVDPQKPFGVTTSTEHFATKEEADAWADEHNLKRMFVRDERVDRPEGAVPDAPFKKNWHELMLKRMLKYATEHGYDGVSWTPGEEQAARYDLSKQVDAIHYRSAGPRMFSVEAYRQGVGTVLSQTGTPEELEGVVGKDIVRKMVAKEGEEVGGPGDFRKLTGVDLKVGGEGMKGFYDKIIPDAANKLGKQWGAKVGETKIGSSSENPYSQYEGPAFGLEDLRKIATDHTQNNHVRDEADAVVRAIRGGESYDKAIVKHGSAALAVELKGDLVAQKQTKTVPYLPITPEMRAGVKAIPYSLFSIPLAAGALSLQQIKEQADKLKKGATR